jgi:hypothetical protein
MDAAALGAFLRGAKHDLFRLEIRDFYEPDREGYERWLAGDGLDEAVMGPWLERLRAEKARGLRRRRVHVLRSPLAPYLRYECELYARNARAGEGIRILDTAERPGVPGSRMGTDFWAVDRRDVVIMHYTPEGAFTSARRAPPAAVGTYLALAARAWDAAEPFQAWWARHRSDRKAA